MTLHEIKEMLGKISPWPWKSCGLGQIVTTDLKKDVVLANKLTDFDAEFIAQAPTIISDLVKKIEELNLYKQGLIQSQDINKDLELKYQAARNVAINYREELEEHVAIYPVHNLIVDEEISEEEKRLKNLLHTTTACDEHTR